MTAVRQETRPAPWTHWAAAALANVLIGVLFMYPFAFSVHLVQWEWAGPGPVHEGEGTARAGLVLLAATCVLVTLTVRGVGMQFRRRGHRMRPMLCTAPLVLLPALLVFVLA